MKKNNGSVILDSMDKVGIYVLEEHTYKLLYFNRKIQKMIPQIKLGMDGRDLSFGAAVDLVSEKILWDETIPAVLFSVLLGETREKRETKSRLIEEMYARSLVTIFDECVIVNLTGDYYVNCQKDMLWSNISEYSNFGEENIRYSRATIHPDDLEEFNACFSREAILKAFEEGKTRIIKRLRRLMMDGSYHMVEYTAARIDVCGGECWGVLVFRDVNDEYLYEQWRTMEITQLATAARVAFEMLIAVNLTQNTYYMMEYSNFRTKKAEESGNFDELIEVGAATVDPEYQEEFKRKFSRKSLLEAFARGEKQVSMEMRQLGDDGTYYWNSTQVVRVESPYSDDILEITMSKSIEEERRQQEYYLRKEHQAKELLEEALLKAESANMAKSDFLSRMSHDIRTPMNAIMGMTTLAQINIKEERKLKEYLENIEISGKHLLGLINEVLDVSKIESGKAELVETEFDLRDMAGEVISMVKPSTLVKEQELTVEFSKPFHGYVAGDSQRLRQVLVNILDNASKYTGQGGTITFSIKELERKGNSLGTYQFVITDTGIGMKKEYLEHIYEPFSRACDSSSQETGTGLGLTIVQNIMNLMGGNIQVESEYGKGTSFIITICLLQKGNPERRPDSREKVRDDFHGMRILLVEDNRLNQQIAREMLMLLGAEVEVAENGKQAVDFVLEKGAYYYSLVFMDIQMPVMNGYEATVQIRNSGREGTRELPIIAMTADAFSEDRKKSRMNGMNGHLSKPISMDHLKQTLNAWSK